MFLHQSFLCQATLLFMIHRDPILLYHWHYFLLIYPLFLSVLFQCIIINIFKSNPHTTHALIRMNYKILSQWYQSTLYCFHIEISHYIIQSLHCVIVQILKIYSRCVKWLTILQLLIFDICTMTQCKDWIM